MNPTPEQIVKLITDNQWRLLICVIVIGFIVRLSKGDVPWFPTIPSRWRPVFSLALGIAASIADHIANGTPWKNAIVLGLIAGLVPVSGHEVIVNALRGGRDLPAPLSTPTEAVVSPANGEAAATVDTAAPPTTPIDIASTNGTATEAAPSESVDPKKDTTH